MGVGAFELLKSSSRLALLAAAGMGLAIGSARAADLGGDCCADLEERVATLEATTARKSNKLVSLTIGGQVNRGILWYNDGSMSGFRSADSIASSSRMRMIGSAKIAPGWSAGYYLEIEFISTSSNGTDQIDSRRVATSDPLSTTQPNGHGNSPMSLGIRQSHWYLKNDTLGTVSVGHLNSAAKDIAGIDLGNITVISDGLQRYSGAEMFVRREGTTGREGLCAAGLGCAATVRWSNFWVVAENWRMDGVRWDSPTVMGFTLSAAAGDDYRADVALRYAGEWNGLRVAAGIGYQIDQDEQQFSGEAFTTSGGAINTTFGLKTGRRDQRDLKLNGSALHVATGLFVTGQWWNKSFQGSNGGALDTKVAALDPNRGQRDDITYWRLAGGIRKNVFGIGDTSLYGEYGHVSSPLDGTALNTSSTTAGAVGGINFAAVTKSEMTIWGLGVVQNIDKAAMTMYLGYRNNAADVAGCTSAANCAGNVIVQQKFESLDTVYGGAVVRF